MTDTNHWAPDLPNRWLTLEEVKRDFDRVDRTHAWWHEFLGDDCFCMASDEPYSC